MWGYSGHAWDWTMGFGMVGMSIFWIVVILAVIALVRGVGRSSATPPQRPKSRAIEILEERYARGEIDQAEFEERRRNLA